MRQARGTFAEKPTRKFTSAGGLNRYAHRQGLITCGPQLRVLDQARKSETPCLFCCKGVSFIQKPRTGNTSPPRCELKI